MDCGGFALLDVWELCTAYYVRTNKLNRPGLHSLMDEVGFARGVIQHRDPPEPTQPPSSGLGLVPAGIEAQFSSALAGTVSVVVAGAAGGKVRTAATLAGKAAIASGLWAAQRDDYLAA